VRGAEDRKNSHSGHACIPSLHVVHSVRRIIYGFRLGLHERGYVDAWVGYTALYSKAQPCCERYTLLGLAAMT
jgi:hypothetical protein